MKGSLLSSIVFALSPGMWAGAAAQAPVLPPNYPKAQYDESKAPSYTLPELLTLKNGQRVNDAATWRSKRRPEILSLFAENVYGRTMAGHPREMHWQVVSENRAALHGRAVTKTVRLYFANGNTGLSMQVDMILPVSKRPVPVFLIAGPVRMNERVLERGYGIVGGRIEDIQPDSPAYAGSIRGFLAPAGQTEPRADEWGTIGAWAWGLSRALDYLESDRDVDAKKVSVVGFSRFGKAAMWAGAQDERFAIVYSGESGCAGATIVRRQYGETVKSITDFAPYWFAANFKAYAERVDDLPVDWHMLIALMAPRPVYIATAEEDYWGDPRGSFLAAKAAEPAYRLFGEAGLGTETMPKVNTTVGEWIGYHERSGGHGLTEFDWEQFLNFADRHFGIRKKAER